MAEITVDRLDRVSPESHGGLAAEASPPLHQMRQRRRPGRAEVSAGGAVELNVDPDRVLVGRLEGQRQPTLGRQLLPFGEGLGDQLVLLELDGPFRSLFGQQLFEGHLPGGEGFGCPDPGGREDAGTEHAQQLDLDHRHAGLVFYVGVLAGARTGVGVHLENSMANETR